MYNQIQETDFKPSPLNWCAINVCYESLKEAGFLDVSAKQNIKGFLSKFKLTETYGYIYEFYKYLENLRTQPRDDYQIVDPIGSRIEIKVGYLRNWCGAQVCHADLINEGYIYEHVVDNYIYVLPSINFTDYLDFTINVNPERDYIEPATYDILANISPRSPLDWCKYTVVPYNIPFQ
ncbi:uncharacterized protein LOC100575704 isoform X2 [Acyrthosiphon pisum]|uniref:Uncharacterized protein n=1 Tax=Acyrthosiphon pisum TaxID=7029 RepID=A0A8R2D631_ACYPI|nr:uncharacterized protein LOC100575704 isoform X2 [Acyrthosiphon pisum]|eukprot:XP_016663328.1 PREDICTED: uncharacterized protein LOC100575704 isoform X2 [Acyrthosiphon pisum]